MRSAPPTDEMPVGGNERILFIDDELPIVKISKELLQNLGYQVTVKTKANQAIELFKLRPDEFDLVITDFYMPKLNGMLLVEELRKLRADIPIIMISGFVDHQTIERVKKIGVQEFLRKPLMTMEIAKVIRKVLDNAKQ
ncbi:MAG: response regulator [Calditrichae bacterium]|nr:response regulator [Calditrichia bacterium]